MSDEVTQLTSGSSAEDFLERSRRFIEKRLDALLPAESEPPRRLHQAMRYSIFAGGKRLRPALALASAEAVGGAFEDAAQVACCVEMIHTYSLIHDDLPAMDNDDLRRGRPTCHKVFGEAMAILAGDALLTCAFQALVQCSRREAIPDILEAIAGGAGCKGMVGGQVLDIEAEARAADLEAVKAIHARKTAALIAASCQAGALAGGADRTEAVVIRDFGLKIGLAFQILDDILDVISSPEQLGKTPGKDLKAGKATYPAVAGLGESRAEAERLVSAAQADLVVLGERGWVLSDLARFVIERRS
jgi:geranylgeranyl diphosphate synthase type II